jgi:hypothetical protein
MTPPRFRLRTLLIAVAVVAMLTGSVVLARRSSQYRRWARLHHRIAARFRAEQRSWASTGMAGREQAEMWRRRARATASKSAVEAADAAESAEAAGPAIAAYEVAARAAGTMADHYALLGKKYERLARHPWLPVAPDPLPPE